MIDMIYSVRVLIPFFDSLDATTPSKQSPYRTIEVFEESTLIDLARTILDAFEFKEDHFYGFYDNINSPLKSTESFLFLERMIDEIPLRRNINECLVRDLFSNDKTEWLFLFDYENEWNFRLSLLDKKEDKSDIYPKISEAFGTAPKQYENYDDYENDY